MDEPIKAVEEQQKGGMSAASCLRWAAFFLAVALCVAFFAGLLPIAPVAVATGSMDPTIEVGDLVVVCRRDPTSLEVGDIIRYRSGTYTVIHRIVAQETDEDGQPCFITQGDANNGPDADPVYYDQVLGQVVLTVPNAGKFTLWLYSLFP